MQNFKDVSLKQMTYYTIEVSQNMKTQHVMTSVPRVSEQGCQQGWKARDCTQAYATVSEIWSEKHVGTVPAQPQDFPKAYHPQEITELFKTEAHI
eukprot:442297-Amphidinium_carterae.1